MHDCFYRLEEAGVLTDCSIQTQEANETLDFDFCSANVVNKIIMSAEGLREAFAELDMTSDSLEILLSPSSPYFRLSTFGYAGTTQVRQKEIKGTTKPLIAILDITPILKYHCF